ncbi:MAG: sensor histidine kinase [Opitutaceae bacterium]|nr:sensor histidine kinase [Opitutaceae bacterium]
MTPPFARPAPAVPAGARRLVRGCRWALASALVLPLAAAAAELTKAIQVRSLSYDEARSGLEAQIRGTVTFVEGPGAVFVQDDTAGTFFRPEPANKLRPGDVVEVTGRTQPGNYLPGIALAPYRIIGHGPLPPAVVAGYDDLMSGRYHYQRVAIEGIARSVTPVGEGRSVLRVDVGARIVEAWIDVGLEDEAAIVDSRIRVEGLAAGGINRRRQLVQPYLRTRDSSEITVLEPAVPEADVPRVAAANLLTFRVTGQGNHRIRIEGVVTACPSRTQVFVRSGQTAFGLRFMAPTAVEVGDQIDVLGFTEMGQFSATVVDAKLLTRTPGPAPEALESDIPSVLGGARDGDLVKVTAVLTDFFRTENGVVLSLQRNGKALQARGPAMAVDVPIGSLVRASGICQVESSTSVVLTSRPETVTLQLRAREDLEVLESPPWWTARRLVAVLVALGGTVLFAGLWIAVLRRQVRRQTAALRRRIESEAALEERHRIAREFHDSLEQDLTGLALRLDAVATRTFDDKGRQIIEVSRGLLSRIQAETRNFVSDLRDAAENDGDLAAALEAIATRLDHEGGVEVRIDFAGPPPPLPVATVHHLRMIARESVTNALKHAGASRVTIDVAVESDTLRLRVTDDGRGFDAPLETRGKSGHFGCVGIRERARKLGAQVVWRSAPGQGTTVEVTLPLRQTEGSPTTSAAGDVGGVPSPRPAAEVATKVAG